MAAENIAWRHSLQPAREAGEPRFGAEGDSGGGRAPGRRMGKLVLIDLFNPG